MASKEDKEQERAKKRAIHSSVIDELRKDVDEPEEMETRELFQKGKMSSRQLAEEKHRNQYEDENFTRTRVERKDRLAKSI